MKKLFVSIISLLLVFSVQASAEESIAKKVASKWFKFGLTGGMNFNTSKFNEMDIKSPAGWNAGVTFFMDLPLWFSLQPAVNYSHKTAVLSETKTQQMGFVEIPVSVQWGPDLLLFRPFIDVTPFVGYAVSNNMQDDLKAWDSKDRWSYGLGLGAGINVWKFQLLARYCWNLGSLYDVKSWNDLKENVPDLTADSPKFGGVTVNLSFFF